MPKIPKMPNIGEIMKIKDYWEVFKQNHPKFPEFCNAVSRRGIREDMIIEIAVTTPEGEKLQTNMKLKQSDIDIFNALMNMTNQS